VIHGGDHSRQVSSVDKELYEMSRRSKSQYIANVRSRERTEAFEEDEDRRKVFCKEVEDCDRILPLLPDLVNLSRRSVTERISGR
jgi:hypothetical protein